LPSATTVDIRGETDADVRVITDVTVAAFKTQEISNQIEPIIIDALRAAKVLTVSLVAELEGRVIGHIAFSLVTMSDGTRNWYGLGPVSEWLNRLKGPSSHLSCLFASPGVFVARLQQHPAFRSARGRSSGVGWITIKASSNAGHATNHKDCFARAGAIRP